MTVIFSGFTFLAHEVSMLSIMSFLGLLVSVFIGRILVKKQNIVMQDAFYMLLYVLIGVFIGAKLFYFIFSAGPLWITKISVLKNIFRIIMITMGGGLVFYGGLLGGIAGGALYLTIYKVKDASKYIMVAFTLIPLFHFFGRLGCFFTGCCHGFICDKWYCVTYINSPVVKSGISFFPVQLIESLLNLVLFFIMLFLLQRVKFRWDVYRHAGIYFIFYGCIRFILEFFRGDAIRGIYGSFSTSQWISFFIVFYGIILLSGIIPKIALNNRLCPVIDEMTKIQ